MNREELMKQIEYCMNERTSIEEAIDELGIEEQILIFNKDLLEKKSKRLHKRHSDILIQMNDLFDQLAILNESEKEEE